MLGLSTQHQSARHGNAKHGITSQTRNTQPNDTDTSSLEAQTAYIANTNRGLLSQGRAVFDTNQGIRTAIAEASKEKSGMQH